MSTTIRTNLVLPCFWQNWNKQTKQTNCLCSWSCTWIFSLNSTSVLVHVETPNNLTLSWLINTCKFKFGSFNSPFVSLTSYNSIYLFYLSNTHHVLSLFHSEACRALIYLHEHKQTKSNLASRLSSLRLCNCIAASEALQIPESMSAAFLLSSPPPELPTLK